MVVVNILFSTGSFRCILLVKRCLKWALSLPNDSDIFLFNGFFHVNQKASPMMILLILYLL